MTEAELVALSDQEYRRVVYSSIMTEAELMALSYHEYKRFVIRRDAFTGVNAHKDYRFGQAYMAYMAQQHARYGRDWFYVISDERAREWRTFWHDHDPYHRCFYATCPVDPFPTDCATHAQISDSRP